MKSHAKIFILLGSICIIFIALISSKILPNVQLSLFDAMIIVFFVILSLLLLLFFYKKEESVLNKKVSEKNYQIQTIINHAPFAMYLKDLDGNILLSNNYYSTMPIFMKQKPQGTNISDLYKNYNISQDEDFDVVQNKRMILVEREVESLEGHGGWYRIIKAPVFNSKREVINIVVIGISIDNERKLQEQRSTFIATLAHDFKTPTLAQIKALDLLLNGSMGALSATQAGIISQIKDSCKYMYDLTFTILNTYLYDNGQIHLKPKNFDWKKFVAETVAEISNLAAEKQQRLILKTFFEGNFFADKFQMKRVITNLISNAITYGKRGSEIEVISELRNDDLFFSVKNQSQYTVKHRLEDMYEKFRTAEETILGKSGTGLGLYLVKQIVSAHGGTVYASSSEKNVCIFGFNVPIAKQAEKVKT